MIDAIAEPKPWQLGYPLARLKALADLFKASEGPHCYGAFGLVKEREVAAALAEGALYESQEGAAIGRRLASTSCSHDFRGEPIRLPAGSLVLSAFGYREAPAALLDALRPLRAQWFEWFREDQALSAQLAAAGVEIVATKISAGSEIKAVGCDDAWAGQFACSPVSPHDALALGVLEPLALTGSALEACREEVRRYAGWEQHYSSYNKRASWTALAIRGYDASDPTFIIKPEEMSRKWRAENSHRLGAPLGWTEARASFPQVMQFLDRLLSRLDVDQPERVRLMRLAPGGGELSRHADIINREAGTRDGQLVRLHIPILTSPLCRFSAWRLDGARQELSLPAGALCYLDQRKPHTVVNSDPVQDRVHLVVDAPANKTIRAMLVKQEEGRWREGTRIE